MSSVEPAPKPTLNDVIDDLLAQMHGQGADTPEYARMVEQLDKIYKLKEVDSKSHVSRDTWAIIGANLVGIVMIVGHERAHVVTSKAMSFLLKLR